MTRTHLITLKAHPSFAPSIEIAVISASGREGGGDLTLAVGSDPLLGGPASREESIRPRDAESIWEMLDDIDMREAEGVAIGLDGTNFSLTIERADARATYSWWGSAAAEWDEVGRLVDKLLRLAGPGAARLRHLQ